MALTDLAIRNAKAGPKPYKLGDGYGLHLVITPKGAKLWRMKYRYLGKEKLLSFGQYPWVSLSDARQKRDEAKTLLAKGTDPGVQKVLDRIARETASRNTFGAVSEEYLANMEAEGAAPRTLSKNRWMLQVLAGRLTNRPIAEISAAEVLDVLQRIERNGRRETARRLRGTIGSIFRLAIATLRAKEDPTYYLRNALQPVRPKHRAAITDETKFGALLRAIDGYEGWPSVRRGLQFAILTLARPGEVRLMRRGEIDFEKAVWHIPAERTKMRRQHDIPLSRQAIELLRDIWPMSDGGDLVFPAVRSLAKPLSDNAFNAALRIMGWPKDEVTTHGFRATASTFLNERGYDSRVIEAALGHLDPNEVRRTYNRATYWNDRVQLMQDWADLVDEFRRGTMLPS